MLSTFFSYRPRSGSRVLAARNGPEVGICELKGGTVAVGALGVLEIPAAKRRHWFRTDAARFAEEVVSNVGGLAEDDRGVVRLAIPRRFLSAVGKAAVDLMGCYDPTLADLLKAQAWRQGCGQVAEVAEYGVTLSFLVKGCKLTLRCWPGWKERTVVRDDGTTETVNRPALWFGDGYGNEIAVTDAGRPVKGWLDGNEYTSPLEAVESIEAIETGEEV